MLAVISDLHLERPQEPAALAFSALLDELSTRQCTGLYILGDLFEAWVGDDEDSEIAEWTRAQLRRVVAAGVRVELIVGNRDFLIGSGFAAQTGVRVVAEPLQLQVGGRRLGMVHGDTLCTEDHAYLKLRQQLRDPAWQAAFLAQPLAARRAFAAKAREASRMHTASAAQSIMDATADGVLSCMQSIGCELLIHGHTHRPALHAGAAPRIVTGDWHAARSVLWLDQASGLCLEAHGQHCRANLADLLGARLA